MSTTSLMTFDVAGLDVLSISSPGGLTSVFTRLEGNGVELDLGILRSQQSGPASLLELLRSAYSSGLLAAWNAASHYDEDGTPLDDLGDEVLGV